MSNELRAAAERVNRMRGQSPLQVYEHEGRTETFEALYTADLIRLAEAYLAEHPADDAEPVTEEWLRSVGFTSGTNYGPSSLHLNGLSAWKGNDNGDWQFRFELSCCNRHKSFDTRGDVRRLCRALGVELKETDDGLC